MTCEKYTPLLSEYADGRLDAERRGRIEEHLARCSACAALVGDFRAMGGLLRGLPLARTSAGFEAQLAGRLTQKRLGPARAPWSKRLADFLRPAPLVWRSALALGAAAATVAGALTLQHPIVPVDLRAPSAEGSLVAQCVRQHRSDVGAQPLSDPAAQTLANHLDETSPALTAPLPGENDF